MKHNTNNIIRYCLSLVFICLALQLWAEKRIYITLDVSGSMNNQKYEYANYGAQMLQVLNQNNEVILIVRSQKIKLKGKSAYKDIQKAFPLKRGGHSEIADIKYFNEIFNNSKKNQELFIIGDGIWNGNTPEIQDGIIKHVASGNLRVTFLEILNNKNKKTIYEEFLQQNHLAKIYKTDNDNDLQQHINTIAEEITGVSGLSIHKIQQNGNCLSFAPEVNVEKIIFVYQDATKLKQLPQIQTTNVGAKQSKTKQLGSPSTEKFVRHGGLVSSNVYALNQNIIGGTNIELCFDQKIDLNKIKIFPITNVLLDNANVELITGSAKKIDQNTIGVCIDNQTAKLSTSFTDKDGNAIVGGNIENTKVVFVSNGKRYTAKYKNGKFETEIPLVGTTTTYRIESELKGYFRRNSGEKKIKKIADCAKEKPIEKQKASWHGNISLEQFIAGHKIYLQIIDEATGKTIQPHIFDIAVKNNYPWLFDDIKIEFEGDSIALSVKSKGFWCDCFVPKQLIFDFKAKPKVQKSFDGKQYQPIAKDLVLDMVSQKSWLNRCKWILAILCLILGLMWYISALIKKNRFWKKAKIILKSPHFQNRNQYNETRFPLREKNLWAWINRWFNPFIDEKQKQQFTALNNTSIQFKASEKSNRIYFLKANFNPKNMRYSNYNENDNTEWLAFSQNEKIQVNQREQGRNRTYFLEYECPQKSQEDITLFKNLLKFVFIVLFIALIILSFFTIKSLLNIFI